MKGSASGVFGRWGVATTLLLLAALLPARADVTTERGASILIYPKVLSDSQGLQTPNGPVDTLIQISNKSNSLVFAHCFYVNASLTNVNTGLPCTVQDETCLPQWQEKDFDVVLTKQQPTQWLASQGRNISQNQPQDQRCTASNHDCELAGFDPGFIPPVNDPFTGELKCIEVDSTGAPLNGNHLKGEATLVTPNDGDASKYNAIGILGLNTDSGPNNGDNVLCLGGGVSAQCPTGAEYNGCPQSVILDNFAENAPDPVVEELGNGPSTVHTQLTVVPCTENFELALPTSLTVQFLITNEFEQQFSTSTTVECWGNYFLDDISRVFDYSILGTRFAQTVMTAPDTDASGNPESGFVGVAEEFHYVADGGPYTARSALNLHGQGVRTNSDLVTISGFQ